jgi:hypothetical protein
VRDSRAADDVGSDAPRVPGPFSDEVAAERYSVAGEYEGKADDRGANGVRRAV